MTARAFWRVSPRGEALAVAVYLLAFALRAVLDPWFPPGFPYLTFFPAIVLVTYLAGLRPGILSAVLSGLTAWWFFIGGPGFEFGHAALLAMGFYVGVVAVDLFFIDGMERASHRAEQEALENRRLAESRDLLFRELEHRVSNNLQVVSALLALQAHDTRDPQARKALQEAVARTALIGKVQRGLRSKSGDSLPFARFARDLLEDALLAAGRSDVRLVIESELQALQPDLAAPVSLVMLECVNNALEHALADRPGTITVSLVEADGAAVLTIADDGQGLSRDLDPARPASLGLRIVQGMAGQLAGRFDLGPNPDGSGARARLTYPLNRPDPLSAGVMTPD